MYRILTIAYAIFCFSVVFAQNDTVNVSPEGNNTDIAEAPPVACKPGSTVGYMIIRQPNMSSIVTVGTPYNISWQWSVAVTQIPAYVDVYVQLMTSGVTVTWKNKVLSQQSTDPSWFMWTPKAMMDGKYKMRLVPDGKETWGVPANELPCFSNGESIPSVSATFSVVNSKGELIDTRNDYMPNSKGLISYANDQFLSMWLLSLSVLFLFVRVM